MSFLKWFENTFETDDFSRRDLDLVKAVSAYLARYVEPHLASRDAASPEPWWRSQAPLAALEKKIAAEVAKQLEAEPWHRGPTYGGKLANYLVQARQADASQTALADIARGVLETNRLLAEKWGIPCASVDPSGAAWNVVHPDRDTGVAFAKIERPPILYVRRMDNGPLWYRHAASPAWKMAPEYSRLRLLGAGVRTLDGGGFEWRRE